MNTTNKKFKRNDVFTRCLFRQLSGSVISFFLNLS